MQNNLRLSTSNSEFAKELLATMNDTEEFLIWHSLEDHRILSKAFVSSVESNDDITLIVKFETDKNLAENNQKFYFLYNEKSEILFKGEVRELTDSSVSLKISEKKYLKERRCNNRIEFNNISVKIQIKTVESLKKETNRIHEVTISDISETGVSFLITRSQSLLFEIGSTVILSKIEKIKLPVDIDGKTVHVTEMIHQLDEAGNARVMIGVKFDKPSRLIGIVIDEVKKED